MRMGMGMGMSRGAGWSLMCIFQPPHLEYSVKELAASVHRTGRYIFSRHFNPAQVGYVGTFLHIPTHLVLLA